MLEHQQQQKHTRTINGFINEFPVSLDQTRMNFLSSKLDQVDSSLYQKYPNLVNTCQEFTPIFKKYTNQPSQFHPLPQSILSQFTSGPKVPVRIDPMKPKLTKPAPFR